MGRAKTGLPIYRAPSGRILLTFRTGVKTPVCITLPLRGNKALQAEARTPPQKDKDENTRIPYR